MSTTLAESVNLHMQFLKKMDNQASLKTILEGVELTNSSLVFEIINLINTEQEAQATLLLSERSNASNEEVTELIQAIKHAM
ncbi:MAG: hypothetical protein GY797_09215 [Deltaproteobacteria bacterium]|nr:hypothetical protein [Deltaproteobacteria bacterium]